MAEQTVYLNPGESKVVSFEATPHEARTYYVSVDGLTGSFKAIGVAAARIAQLRMWYSGLIHWVIVNYINDIPFNEEISLRPYWVNESTGSIVGHIDVLVTYPDGTTHELVAYAGQDRETVPGEWQAVSFDPFLATQRGEYIVKITLSSEGQVLDTATFTLECPVLPSIVEITSISLSPMGDLYESDRFTISITFANPSAQDVWVRPKFALGKWLNDLFEAEAVLGHVGYPEMAFTDRVACDWVDLGWNGAWGSGMSTVIYDPEGKVADQRSYAYLRVPAKGEATTSLYWGIYHRARQEKYQKPWPGVYGGITCFRPLPPADFDVAVTIDSIGYLEYVGTPRPITGSLYRWRTQACEAWGRLLDVVTLHSSLTEEYCIYPY